ncbi:MAG: FkbM family methyltransferase [Nitrospira sp.]|nr:FkbM family methyltransferase [Nitrospira sp.]
MRDFENKHHEVFRHFKCWEGIVQPGYNVDFVGAITRASFYKGSFCYKDPSFVAADYPEFDEEYFPWIDVLESIIAARDQFVMMELGAGYGKWLVRAAKALREISNMPYLLIGVEAEPEHYQWMKTHFLDNGIDPKNHLLIEAAVSDQDGHVMFETGRGDEHYGHQIIIDVIDPSLSIKDVPAISLHSLLNSLDKVDLIDVDVQGAELKILTAAKDELNRKVKRIHIGTHNSVIETGLRSFFYHMGWQCLNDYSYQQECSTQYGIIKFDDGVQTWVNLALE